MMLAATLRPDSESSTGRSRVLNDGGRSLKCESAEDVSRWREDLEEDEPEEQDDVDHVRVSMLPLHAHHAIEKMEEFVFKVWEGRWRVIPHDVLPDWLKDNDFLLHGHRPPMPSFRACFRSIFRLHTETGNIWTHLIGFLFFLILGIVYMFRPNINFVAPVQEKVVFGMFFLGAVLCLFFSWIFHTVYCHSEKVSRTFSKLDYSGIALLIMGSFVPWLYYSFYCSPQPRLIYLVIICVLGITAIVVSQWDRFATPQYRAVRAGVFLGLGLSGLVPTLHFMIAEGFIKAATVGQMGWLFLMAILYILGVTLYAARIPERFFPEAGLVSCFSGLDEETGDCTDLIGHGIEEGDCCQNIVYCYQGDHGGESHSCRPSAVWTQWSGWSACTVSCREGVQQRRRRCIGKGRCPGNERLQAQSCVEKECCAVPGGWSAWSPWGRCSVTCAIGNKERFRSCTEPPPACGGTCPGSNRQIQSCVLQDICPTHGSWSVWASWGSCSSSCREEGSSHTPRQRRNRTCNNPTPSFDPPGDPCPGADVDIGLCDFLPFCPVAGNWGSWAESAPCSVSCGIGTVHQSRACDSSPPKYGGPDCSGIRSRNVLCNTGLPCPVDGVWTNWGQWSLCARTGWNITCTQFVGQQRRTRHCRGRSHGGEPCQGSIIEVRTCYDSDNCWYGKGVWSDWSDWGLCHPPCGEGSSRSRSRVCEPVYPKYPGLRGILKQVNVSFSGYPIIECDELEGEHETLQEYRPCQHVPPCD